MKLLTILFSAFCLLFCKPLLAQDRITEMNGNEHIVIVTDITPDSVFYREIADSVNQKVYSVNRNMLFMITYKNGTKEVFPREAVKAEAPKLSKQEYYRLGKQDASNNFKSNGAFWGTFTASLVPPLWPVGGIVTGAAVSLHNPDKRNVIASKPEYKQNIDYLDGYNNQAKKKKLASAAGGFVAAIGVVSVVIALAFSGLK